MHDLVGYVRDLLEQKGVSVPEEEVLRVARDLLRWRRRPEKGGVVRTADGSYTLLSPLYGEPYHSITAGAVTECLLKFVEPSRILERVPFKGEVRILDLGFGLGYNTAVAVTEIRKVSRDVRINVIALDLGPPREVPPLPEPYGTVHREILGSLPLYESGNVRVRLLSGDARKTIKEVLGFGADAVFHDPFSPFRNPELWTLDFLKLVKEVLSPEGLWVSYTSALPVRRALLDLGFKVGESRPVGRRKGGTVATLRGEVPPLSWEDLRRVRESPYSAPFRDPTLSWDPLRILAEYRITVLLRERGVLSG
jgi:chorismate dehydratase